MNEFANASAITTSMLAVADPGGARGQTGTGSDAAVTEASTGIGTGAIAGAGTGTGAIAGAGTGTGAIAGGRHRGRGGHQHRAGRQDRRGRQASGARPHKGKHRSERPGQQVASRVRGRLHLPRT